MFDVHLAGFIAVAILVVISPGPDMLLVARHSLGGGAKAGVVTGLGVCSGLLVHAAAAALGISAVLATSATAFTVVKVIGGGYLVVIGLLSLRSALRRESDGAALQPAPERSMAWRFRQGWLTNVLNPKVAILFVSLLPQFVDRDGAVLAQTLFLAAVFILMGVLWLVPYALVVAKLGERLLGGMGRRVIEGVAGTVLVGLGIGLATTDP